jgi:hypothetical protein
MSLRSLIRQSEACTAGPPEGPEALPVHGPLYILPDDSTVMKKPFMRLCE